MAIGRKTKTGVQVGKGVAVFVKEKAAFKVGPVEAKQELLLKDQIPFPKNNFGPQRKSLRVKPLQKNPAAANVMLPSVKADTHNALYTQAALDLRNLGFQQYKDVLLSLLRDQLANIKYYSSISTLIIGAWSFLIFNQNLKLYPRWEDKFYLFSMAISLVIAVLVFFKSIFIMSVSLGDNDRQIFVMTEMSAKLDDLEAQGGDIEVNYQKILGEYINDIDTMQERCINIINDIEGKNKSLGIMTLCAIGCMVVALASKIEVLL